MKINPNSQNEYTILCCENRNTLWKKKNSKSVEKRYEKVLVYKFNCTNASEVVDSKALGRSTKICNIDLYKTISVINLVDIVL